jgi:tripartite-type tricarboxylate transporter receptor subunit TctC
MHRIALVIAFVPNYVATLMPMDQWPGEPIMIPASPLVSRPVRIVIPFAPGGPTDTFGRLIAQRLSEHFRKQSYVENILGAGGNIGISRAAKAPADGSTIPPMWSIPLSSTKSHMIQSRISTRYPVPLRRPWC